MKSNKILILIFVFIFVQCKNEKETTTDFYVNEVGQIFVPLHCNGFKLFGLFDSGASRSITNDSIFRLTKATLSKKTANVIFPHYAKKSLHAKLSKPTFIFLERVRSKERIQLNVYSAKEKAMIPNLINSNSTIWGIDIIDQFCWLFDFNTMKVTVSTSEIEIEKKNWTKLHYTKNNEGYFICSLRMNRMIDVDEQEKEFILDDIFIDTGGGAFKALDSIYTTYLTLKSKTTRGVLKFKGNPEDSCIFFKDNNESIYPFVEKEFDNILKYNGISYINSSYSFLNGVNGHLSLGKTGHYSQMYFDTKNQIIYLKK